MPIKHVLAWRFRSGVTDAAQASVLDEFRSLPSHFPQMRNWAVGVNESERDTTFTHAFVVEFDSIDELNAYLHSERHEDFVANRWRQYIEQRAIVSFPYEAAPEVERTTEP